MQLVSARFERAVVMLLAAAVALATRAAGAAEDVVILRVGGGESRRVGTVVDYNGAQLRLRPSVGPEAVLPAEQVVEVRTERTAEQLAGDELRGAVRMVEALEQYRVAARSESRPWVRREIAAGMVRCHRGLGQAAAAGRLFAELRREDPVTRHFDCIPLAWTVRPPDAALEAEARRWLLDQDAALVLVGASHLLAGPARREAIEQLRRLTTDRDARIALLAEAQLWRTAPPAVGEQELERRRAMIGRLPERLRGGPYFLVGQSLAAAGKDEEAVLGLVRAPILFADDGPLAAAALWEAGQRLDRMERREEAERLYREVVERYAGLPEADEARRRLAAKDQR